jgi:hypothetical protein
MLGFNPLALIAGVIGLGTAIAESALNSEGNEKDVDTAVVVPSERSLYFTPDFRLRLTVPPSYQSEAGAGQAPRTNLTFRIDLATSEPAKLTPIEKPSVVVVQLSLAQYDAVNASVERRNRFYFSADYDGWGKQVREPTFGLTSSPNIAYPDGPREEYLYDEGQPHHLVIRCRPSGNAYPSLCTMTRTGPRGADRFGASSNAAIMTEVTFNQSRLSDWKAILDQVDQFMIGKLDVIGWEF